MITNLFTKEIPFLSDFISIFFPKNCLICQQHKVLNHQSFCLTCYPKLPFTNFHQIADNECMDRFWGRIPLEAGAAIFFLQREGLIQEFIYRLKYGDRPKIGNQLGQMYGQILKKQPLFSSIDLIVPIPLHPIRLRKRGYNQSAQFAMGLSDAMEVPLNISGLIRTKATSTQTKKNRLERFENVLPAFQVKEVTPFVNKHILLVDDVLTTGATLEACATRLLEVEGVKISIATIAIAKVG